MNDDDDRYYPEGFDKAEFDALVAQEMAKLEEEARQLAFQSNGGYDDPQPSYSSPPRQKMTTDRDWRSYEDPPQPPLSARDQKRAQQQEYARLLQQDQERRSNGPSRERSRGGSSRRPAVEEERKRRAAHGSDAGAGTPNLDIFGNAATLASRPNSKNLISDSEKEKFDRQREYAQQLEADKMTNQKYASHSQFASDPRKRNGSARRRTQEHDDDAKIEIYPDRGSLSARNKLNDHRSKAEKQRDYARLLENDIQQREVAAPDRADHASPRQRIPSGRRDNRSGGEMYAGGLVIGGDSDGYQDKSSKRRQQAEYAAQLREASVQPAVANSPRDDRTRRYHAGLSSNDENATSIQLGGYDINTSQRIANKKVQQKEYYDELERDRVASGRADHASPRQRIPSGRRDNRSGGEMYAGGLVIGGDSDGYQDKSSKRRQQAEYAAQLREASVQPAVANSPRDDRTRRYHAGLSSNDENATSIQLGGYDINTSQRIANKKVQQKEYYDELERDRVASGRADHVSPKKSNGAQLRTDSTVREPNMKIGRGYEDSSIGSPGQGRPENSLYQKDRHSEAIIAARDRGYVGADKGRYNVRHDNGSYNGSLVKDTDYFKADENLDQFRPSAVSSRVRDYKDRQDAYAKALADDAAARDIARASSGVENQDSRSSQARQRAASTGRIRPNSGNGPYDSKGTGLMIGGMSSNTAQIKEQKRFQQQQYAADIANAKNAPPIPESYRSVYRDQTEYMGNGLPGAANILVRDQPSSKYHNAQDFNTAGRAASRQKDFQFRGESTGGGRSQISF